MVVQFVFMDLSLCISSLCLNLIEKQQGNFDKLILLISFACLLILLILISGMHQFVSCNVFPYSEHCCRHVQFSVHSGNPFLVIVNENTFERFPILYPTL